MNAPETQMQLKHQIAELQQAINSAGLHPETLRSMRQELDQKLCAYRGLVTESIDTQYKQQRRNAE